MKALILAAGIASRLRPLTDHTPKCLLPIGNKNILSLTLENLKMNGIKDLVVVTGYLQEKIKSFIQNEFPDLKVTFIYNEVYDSTNNIYSLWLAKKEIIGHDLILLDSDILFDPIIINKLIHSDYANCLALKKHEVKEEEIKVRIGTDGRITEIGKTVIPHEALGESIGIEKFDAAFVDKLFSKLDFKMQIENNVNQFYEAAFEELIQEGENIYPVDVTDYKCMEIDTAFDLELATKLYS
jgi:choline kinase